MHGTAGPVAEVDSVTVRFASEADRGSWNEFVRSSPDATFCHLWEWNPLLRERFGLRPRYLMALGEGGKPEGILPLVEMRTGFSRRHISLPYLNYGGPIGSDAARRALVERALAEAKKAGVKRLELRSRSEAEALAPSRAKVTVVLPLPDTVDELWKTTFRAKLRSQVRRAQREEMELRFGADQANAFYEVFRRNMRDLGTPVLPRAFFDDLSRRFADEVVFAAVYYEGAPVAAGCGFIFGGEFEISWASSLREHNPRAPNMLLYAGLMEEMIRRGVRAFNFGRCTPGGGTHRFKLQWGGEDEPLHWTEWPDADTSGDGEPGELLQMASRVWQRLPQPVVDRVGPRLAARMPQF